jgi:uncharacterized protein YdaU (DUF1376 family)
MPDSDGRTSRLQKPEWFRLDPAKFLSDSLIETLTTEELGCAFRLLCRQWLDGYIPDDSRLLSRLCRLDEPRMDAAWKTLSRFFPVIEDGKRANRFMYVEREKVVADLDRKSDQATRAARKRWDERPSDATAMRDACATHADSNARAEQSRTDQTIEEQNRTFCSELLSATPSSPTVSKLPCSGKDEKEYPITEAKIAEWGEGFPGVDIVIEIRKMRLWLEENPKRRKTFKGMGRFCLSWLERSQNQSRSFSGTAPKAMPDKVRPRSAADKLREQRAAGDRANGGGVA